MQWCTAALELALCTCSKCGLLFVCSQHYVCAFNVLISTKLYDLGSKLLTGLDHCTCKVTSQRGKPAPRRFNFVAEGWQLGPVTQIICERFLAWKTFFLPCHVFPLWPSNYVIIDRLTLIGTPDTVRRPDILPIYTWNQYLDGVNSGNWRSADIHVLVLQVLLSEFQVR